MQYRSASYRPHFVPLAYNISSVFYQPHHVSFALRAINLMTPYVALRASYRTHFASTTNVDHITALSSVLYRPHHVSPTFHVNDHCDHIAAFRVAALAAGAT